MSTLLAVDSLAKSFGGVHAVNGATFTVEEGSITGLIGPNGAGKTTTFDLISGQTEADDGAIRFSGRVVSADAAHARANAGMVRTFQIPRSFLNMTVWENLLFAGTNHPGERFWQGILATRASKRREREISERAGEVLEFLEISHVADIPGGSLSGGQRKLLGLGRALMQDPRLILLDEPLAGVAPSLTAKIADKLADLRSQGMTILLIEHDLETVMRLVDKLIVMHLGAVLKSGDPTTVRADPAVLEAYLGGANV